MKNIRDFSYIKALKSIKMIIGLMLLLCMCLVAKHYKIPLSYGVYITFSSLFLFIILRIYGVVLGFFSSVVASILAFIFLRTDTISVFVPLEILFVGLIYKYKSKNIFLADILYWLVLGGPLIIGVCFLKGIEFSIDFKVALINQIIIGLINALLSDIVISYISPQRILKSNMNYTIDFKILLFHFTLISVLVPFAIFVFNEGLSINIDTNSSIIETIENKEYDIMNQLNNWSSVDLRKIRIKSPIQINRIKNILNQEPEGSIVGLMIQDNNGNIYVSNDQASEYEKINIVKTKSIITTLKNDIYLQRPDIRNCFYDEEEWKSAYFIKEIKFEDIDLKLVIKVPLINDLNEIWSGYFSKFNIILFACFIATIISIFISKFLSSSLLKLADSTTDIPNKLSRQEKISWPNTSISEIRSLVLNFAEMSNKLEQVFLKEKEMNNRLRIQTDELEKSREELKHLAYHDALTGLPNRLFFMDYLKRIVNSDDNSYKIIAIMFIDLNRFKQINDTLGHEVGDMLLKEVSRRLKAISRSDTFISRLGGDEFVVVLEEADKLKAAEMGKFINKILSDNVNIVYNEKEIELLTSGSIGISIYPLDSNDINTVLKYADISMYYAKKSGGNKVCFYEEIDKEDKEEQMKLETSLKKALKNKELQLYYQPQFNLKGRNITTIEALIRWNHPELGLLLPSKFIPLASKIGLTYEIGYWVLKEACTQMRLWNDKDIINTHVTVNISGDSFQGQYVVDIIKKVLNETGLNPELLGVDITESYLLNNIDNLKKMVDELKRIGVFISIDDFGKGGSSIAILKDIPIDCVKLDNVLIKKISTDIKTQIIVKALIDMARSMNIKVVAKGLENIENVKILKDMGCDDIYGFLLRSPLDKNSFENWLINYNIQGLAIDL